jgi:signal transduction histidine kinase
VRRILRALWIALAIALTALGVYTYEKQIDAVAHERYSHDIREMETLDARLNGEVMQSRQSLVTHYDDIVATLAALEALHKRLADPPGFLGPREQAEIGSLVKASAGELAEKELSIETFKSQNAILRNSVRFFPVAALELRDELEADPEAAPTARYVNELMCNVLRFNTQPSETLRVRASKDLVALESMPPPARYAEELGVVVTHAKAVLAHRDDVDELTNGIVQRPTRERIDALDAAYARTHQAALRTSEQRKIMLFLLAFLVLGLGSADIILALRKTARSEREASEKLSAANSALLREKEREKELSDLKSRFVSMTSHEFRTPLSVILSSTELLEAYGDRWQPAKKADHFSRIKGAVRGMAELLDGILVIGKADMGRLAKSPARLDLRRYLRELVDTTQPTLGPNHTFVWDVADELGEACVDEKLLNHILTNLLSNAVKYSPDGGVVRFDAWRDGDDAVFEIEDHGIGITGADLERLYESFHRGSNVGHIPGTGLGLAVVKRSVDAHGGTLEVRTEEGEGTTFTVRIPLETDPSSSPAPPASVEAEADGVVEG